MIPPKLLMYRCQRSDASVDVPPETWRRKKSCGELFQNGYRVRLAHHVHLNGEGNQRPATGLFQSACWSRLKVLSNWGKSCCLRETTWYLLLINKNSYSMFYIDIFWIDILLQKEFLYCPKLQFWTQ